MNSRDHDGERRRLKPEYRRRWAGRLVNPISLKAILTIGPIVAKVLSLLIELVKLFKG